MASSLIVSPAYGKDYRNKDDVMAGYHAGHDFFHQSIMGSGYVNKQDHPEGTSLIVRYGRGMKMHTIPFSESKKEYKAKTAKPKKSKMTTADVETKLSLLPKPDPLSEAERAKYMKTVKSEVKKTYGNRK